MAKRPSREREVTIAAWWRWKGLPPRLPQPAKSRLAGCPSSLGTSRYIHSSEAYEKLERELRRQLNPSRSAASKERIAHTNVSSRHNLVSAVANLAAIHGIRSESAAAN